MAVKGAVVPTISLGGDECQYRWQCITRSVDYSRKRLRLTSCSPDALKSSSGIGLLRQVRTEIRNVLLHMGFEETGTRPIGPSADGEVVSCGVAKTSSSTLGKVELEPLPGPGKLVEKVH